MPAEPAESFWTLLADLVPLLATVVVVIAVLLVAHRVVIRNARKRAESLFPGQLVMLLLTGIAIVAVVLALPVGEATRGQLLGLLGLLLTAVIGLSSTTFVTNAMAGIMLRAVRSFRPGDFVRVGDDFGRVTERGLFHTEIQTVDRDLTTLPNLYLVTNPVTVVHASGTIVSTTLSLGYDLAHGRVEPLLVRAAEAAELEEPFVQVVELGDFSITYRVAGFLREVKQLLSVRSNLRKAVLDTLHGDGIEIMSPMIIARRPLRDRDALIPPDGPEATPAAPPVSAAPPEDLVFDKAEAAERLETLRDERERLADEIKEHEKRVPDAADAERPGLETEIARMKVRLEAIEHELEAEPGRQDD